MSASALEKLTHDVRSRCASLRSAADLLQDSSPSERAELLGLMTEQAERLARDLAAFPRPEAG